MCDEQLKKERTIQAQYNEAEAFFQAATMLFDKCKNGKKTVQVEASGQLSEDGKNTMLFAPAIICMGMSCELIIKAILAKENPSAPKRGHSIFELLSSQPNIQSEIKKRFKELYNSYFPLMKLTDTDVNDYFDSSSDKWQSSPFVAWRYFYEIPQNSSASSTNSSSSYTTDTDKLQCIYYACKNYYDEKYQKKES